MTCLFRVFLSIEAHPTDRFDAGSSQTIKVGLSISALFWKQLHVDGFCQYKVTVNFLCPYKLANRINMGTLKLCNLCGGLCSILCSDVTNGAVRVRL